MSMNSAGCLYIYEFENGKKYVGITIRNFKLRNNEHLNNAKNGNKNLIYNAIRKYGDNFTKRVLALSNNWEYLCMLEKRAILAYETLTPKGYNATIGGDGTNGYKHSESSKLKMSISKQNMTNETKELLRIAASGVILSEETKFKMSLAKIGKTKSNETKSKMSAYASNRPEAVIKKMSISASNRVLSIETKEKISNTVKLQMTPERLELMRINMLGKKHSEETKQKMKDAQLKRWAKIKEVL